MDWAQLIESVGKVSVEVVAILVLGVGLYMLAASFKKMIDSYEKQAVVLEGIKTTLENINDFMQRLEPYIKK